jgi:hypothetical protein
MPEPRALSVAMVFELSDKLASPTRLRQLLELTDNLASPTQPYWEEKLAKLYARAHTCIHRAHTCRHRGIHWHFKH